MWEFILCIAVINPLQVFLNMLGGKEFSFVFFLSRTTRKKNKKTSSYIPIKRPSKGFFFLFFYFMGIPRGDKTGNRGERGREREM